MPLVYAKTLAELHVVLEMVNASQRVEKDYVTEAPRLALDHVLENAMI